MISKILSFVRIARNDAKLSDVAVDIGGGEILTAENSQGSGQDAHPLRDDNAIVSRVPRNGAFVVVGYVEPDATLKAAPGEVRTYARNDDREEVAEIWLRNTGHVDINNSQGSLRITPDGTITLDNGGGTVTVDADGTITTDNGNGSHIISPNGNHTITNGGGSIELLVAGVINITSPIINLNGVVNASSTVGVAGQLTAPLISAGGKEMVDHTHPIIGGSSAGTTGPNN